MTVQVIMEDLAKKAEQIEREKDGKALTADETRTLKAVGFLRQIAPYMFEVKTEK